MRKMLQHIILKSLSRKQYSKRHIQSIKFRIRPRETKILSTLNKDKLYYLKNIHNWDQQWLLAISIKMVTMILLLAEPVAKPPRFSSRTIQVFSEWIRYQQKFRKTWA